MRRLLADTTPLQNPHYRRLWTTSVVTMIGSALSVVAVPVQVYEITRSSGYVGLTGVFGLVPLVIFGLWGGAIADVMDRRTVVIVTTAGVAVTTGLLWAQAAAGNRNVWLVLGLFAAQQAFQAVSHPTRSAILPRLLPAEQLPAANSLNMTVFQFGSIAGPVLAGALIPVFGLATLYLIDTVALALSVWAVWRLPSFPPAGDSRRAGFREVAAGFGYIATQPILLASFVVDIIAMVFGMPRALFPQMAHDSFGDPVEGGLALGLLYAAMAVGGLLGGVFSGWVSRVRRQGLTVLVSIALWGLAIVGFGIAVALGWLWIALACLAFGGAADMASAAFRQAMLQSVATDEMRGRLQGVFFVVVAGGPRIGDFGHGVVAASVGTVLTATGGGVLVIVGIVIAAACFPAFVRYLPDKTAR